MQKPYPLIILSLIMCLFLFGFGLPKNIEKKVLKELQKVFLQNDFQMSPIRVSDTLNARLPQKINEENFFELTNNTVHLGYVFVGKAPSKAADFDFLIVFDPELKIIHSKVLVYREEYGGEIGSKRWLKQFVGKTVGDRVDHERNIDGIAGATISVRSMTNAIDELLQTIGILQENLVL